MKKSIRPIRPQSTSIINQKTVAMTEDHYNRVKWLVETALEGCHNSQNGQYRVQVVIDLESNEHYHIIAGKIKDCVIESLQDNNLKIKSYKTTTTSRGKPSRPENSFSMLVTVQA